MDYNKAFDFDSS